MTEKENNILPEGIHVYQLNIERKYKKEAPKEPELQVTPKVFKRKDEICSIMFETDFIYDFRIHIEIIAFYQDESIKDLKEEELLEKIVANSYPIYSRTLLILSFMLEQMGLTAYVIPYSRFIKLIKKEDN